MTDCSILDYAEFVKFLSAFSHLEKADFDKKIIKTDYKILGLYSAKINEIIKNFLKCGYVNLLTFPDEYHEVVIIKSGVIASDGKTPFSARRELLDKQIESFDSWAHCDGAFSRIKVAKNEKDGLFSYAEELLTRRGEFEIRCGIIIMLSKFLTEEKIDEVLKRLDNIPFGKYYYVDMAVAWLAATALINFKEKTLDFLTKSEKINDFTFCKSLQKARESYRIPEEDKLYYKSLIAARRNR